jgi:hypothetical protein
MKTILTRLIFLCLALNLVACTTITMQSQLDQQTATRLQASIGSTIFRLNRISDLPNAFGKADLYGGKVDRGYAEVKFLGVNERNELILSVTDINRSSTETTMDRYTPAARMQIQNTLTIGGGATPDTTTKFLFDPKKESELSIAGVKVQFIEVKPYSVTYILSIK